MSNSNFLSDGNSGKATNMDQFALFVTRYPKSRNKNNIVCISYLGIWCTKLHQSQQIPPSCTKVSNKNKIMS